MILVDTSVWIDHLHRAQPRLEDALTSSLVLTHPMVIGELALGSLRNRRELLELLGGMPSARVATHEEVAHLIERRKLWGQGLSLVDVHLIASALITPECSLWTADRRLHHAACVLDIASA